MTKFFLDHPEANVRNEISLEEFLDFTIGASLKSAASADDFFEFGTSDKMNLHFAIDDAGELIVICFYTVNKNEIAPFRINILENNESLTIFQLEKKLFAIRQMYAFNYLARKDMLSVAYGNIAAGKYDLEAMLVPAEDQLLVSAASQGSFWLTIIPKSRQMLLDTLGAVVALYPRGRETLIRRAELRTDMVELEVDRKSNENKLDLAKGMISVAGEISKIKDPQMRAALQEEYLKNIRIASPGQADLTNPQIEEEKAKAPHSKSLPRSRHTTTRRSPN